MRFIALSLSFLFLIACKPEPARKLTEDERVADMYWVFSKFDQNYAPRELKEKNFGFDYQELKKQYMEEAKKEQENAAFFQLMHKFIAEFKDAHTSGSIQLSSLPGRSKIAYLGFSGKRNGVNYQVTKLLPTITTVGLNIIERASNYPIKVGDVILEIDGVTLFDALQTDVLPYRNLGNDQSNKTGLLGGLFTRLSHKLPLPKKDTAVLKVKRDDKEFEVEIPWVTKDFVTFRQEQKEAVKKKAQAASGDADYDLDISESQYAMIKSMTQLTAQGMISFETIKNILHEEKDFGKIQTKFYNSIQAFNVLETFKLPQEEYLWPMIDLFESYFAVKKKDEKKKSPFEVLKEKRFVPEGSYPVETSKVYPAYITFKKNANNERESIGYVQINTFSPKGNADDVLKEFKATLKHFADFGVKKVVLDLIDNGGGSLNLGVKLIQALSTEKVELAEIQFKTNENWLDSFYSTSLSAPGDFEKEVARRTFVELDKQRTEELILSTTFTFDKLYPFQVTPNTELVVDKEPVSFEMVLVTNEMCASMCDIFTAMFQDNKLGKFIGTQTMGAGGNVTSHFQAPNSGMIIRQTESLIVRTDKEKSYLENNGVKPDIETEIMNERNSKFTTSLTKAFETLVPTPEKEEKKEEKEESSLVTEVN